MKRMHKISYLIVCLTLILSILGAIVFVNENEHHHCCHHGCTICLQLQGASQLIQNLKGSANNIFSSVLIIYLLIGMGRKLFALVKQTLITLKVELLD